MNTTDIVTPRLRLVTITPAMLHAQEHALHTLGQLLQAHVPPGWPQEEWEPHVYEFLRNQLRDHPHTLGWHRYVMLPGDTAILIGALGSHPKGDHEAEIGYGILEPWQHNGYATEATRALMTHLFQMGVHTVRAQTFPQLKASLRVMEKCGMTFVGPGEEGGDAVCYAVNRETFATLPST